MQPLGPRLPCSPTLVYAPEDDEYDEDDDDDDDDDDVDVQR